LNFPKTLYELPRSLLGAHTKLASWRPEKPGEALEARVVRLEVELAARDLLNRYTYFYDAKDLDSLMRLYSDDCVVVNRRGTYVGPAAIRANYQYSIESSRLSFHNATNVQVAVAPGGSEAWLTAYLYAIHIRTEGPAGIAATCVFHIAKRPDQFKIIESRIVVSDRHLLGPTPPRWTERVPAPTRAQTSEDLISD
jgi:ketosteroid isomerase-like protein